MRKSLKRTLVKYLIILAIATAYLIFVLCTGHGIPCVFYEITGFKCPGCGVSRMLVSIVRFDLASAFSHNPFLFITGPLIIVYLFFSEWRYVKHGNRSLGKWEIFIWVEIVLALIYGVLRNVLPI